MNSMTNPVPLFTGMKVTIMGLGLNGGGLESARYLALNGAECTITDTKDEKALAPSIEKLQELSGPHPPFRFVLGRHEMDDFSKADMVVKNPGVRPDSPYLARARRIETDISLFLAVLNGTLGDGASPLGDTRSPVRLTAVTGSKGKSVTASAVHWVLSKVREAHSDKDTEPFFPGKTFLGGNITVSPLSFLDELGEKDDVVLELSSWQLADLKNRALLKPRAAILTSIMPDHQDRYTSMETYVDDKRIIYQGQDKEDATIACADDRWGMSFLTETPGRPLPYSTVPDTKTVLVPGTHAWLDPESGVGMVSCADGIVEAVPPILLVPGLHNKKNCLAAALALIDLGVPVLQIRENLGTFPGIEHRLEFFRDINGIRFYNDTAATIPEAAAAAVEAFKANTFLILVAGGNDKNLDFTPLLKSAETAGELILLSGTGSEKLIPLLKRAEISFHGPFDKIENAALKALELGKRAQKYSNTRIVVILSPGCTGFGMFKNEFDRGRQWKKAVISLV